MSTKDDPFVRIRDVDEPLEACAKEREVGIEANVNHVLFASCACPPHPAATQGCGSPWYARPSCGHPVYGNPVYGNPVYGNPVYGNPVYGNPVYGNPVYGNPVYGNPVYGNPVYGNPVYGNPVYGNPVYGNPVYGNPVYGNPAPAMRTMRGQPILAPPSPSPFSNIQVQATGRRRSTALPPDPTPDDRGDARQQPGRDVRVAILDTGYADEKVKKLRPTGLAGKALGHTDPEVPDHDEDGFLDPAAGHGTFIAGVIEQVTPGCTLDVIHVLSPYGAGDEYEIRARMIDLARGKAEERPQLVNLSFGGYALGSMPLLADGIFELRRAGIVVVASAGNDGTCLPMFPAAWPDVVAVGAVDDRGDPAPFTNYGPWVDACAPGVDVQSTFFNFNGAELPEGPEGVDPDDFKGWAIWSGTSFAAPHVVAKLAAIIGQEGKTAAQAKTQLIDEAEEHRPCLGALIT